MKKTVMKLKSLLPEHIRVIDRFSIRMPHYIYPPSSLHEIKETHRDPITIRDKIAKKAIMAIRRVFDLATKYSDEEMDERRWINRVIFLETVAGVPGMVGGMGRHLRSLRFLEKDKGRIHHLLEEADNERFHLFIFLTLKRPGILFRLYIVVAQTIFFGFFMLSYLLNPKFSHRFVAYLEEEAVHTYTVMLKHMQEGGCLEHWKEIQAPEEVRRYYSLSDNATFKEVILAVRADEACHREVNHFFSETDEFSQVEYEQTDIQEDVEQDIKKQWTQQKEAEGKPLQEEPSNKKV